MSRTLIALMLLCASLAGEATRSSAAWSENGRPVPETSSARRVNPILQWDRALLVIVRTPGAQPATVDPTHSFAIMHAAIYDAVNAIDASHRPYLVHRTGVSRFASQDAAAAVAAHDVLVQLYPKFQVMLDTQRQQSLAQIPNDVHKAEGVAVGKVVADHMLSFRVHGGPSAAPTSFVFGTASRDYQRGVLLTCALQGCANAGAAPTRRASLTAPMLTRQIPWRQAAPKDLGARGSWWEVFRDPVLNGLEMQASTGSLGVAAAAARVEGARAIAGIGACGQDPEVEQNFVDAMVRATSSQPCSDQGERLPDSAAYDVNALQVTLYTNYERDIWARVRRFTIGTNLQAIESQAVRQAVLFTLEAEIAQTYFLIRYSDEELRILRESIELGDEAMDLVAARTAGGATAELNLAPARKRIDDTQVETRRVFERRANLERSLAGLLGVAPERFRVEPSPFDPRPPAIPPGVPSDLLERRPDIVQAERALATRNGETDVAEVAFFPSLPLTGNQGSASSELMALVDGHSNHSASAAPSWQPPFSAGRIEFDADNAIAIYESDAFDQGMLDYRRRILRAFVEVEDALSRLRLLDQQAQYDATALADVQQTAWARTPHREDPLLALAELNIAQRVSLQTRRQIVREVNDRMLTTVALIKALGGGWSGPQERHTRVASPEPSN